MSRISQKIIKYGKEWPDRMSALEVEFAGIRMGDEWLRSRGSSLFQAYKDTQIALWPDEDHNRWSDLILKEILQNDITAVVGPKDSGKTRGMAKYALVDYFCFPKNTLFIISSTTLQSLETRVWGDIKSLYRRAKERWPKLPGHVVDSKHAICTDNINDESVLVRDMRKGILCVPCKTSAGQTNMTTYVGIKQERKRYIGDEMQFMANSMYESLANAIGPNFKMVCAGNPIGDGDPLDIITEPKGGWGTLPEPEKTVTWDNQRFINSRTVNLVGTDSPNFDYPESEPTKYWYLISRDSIARTVAGYGKDSHQYYSQCKGVRRVGLNSRRVITMELCREHNAMSDCTWRGDPMMKVFALDAAYGGIGGDRCIGGHVEFGMCEDGKVRLSVGPPQLVPVRLSRDESPEDQIATWTKEYCESNDVLPENAFYDSTGRGALGISFARVWSNKINPVEFGGSPSMRPVSNDFFITDFRTKEKRLKRCDEHYRKFVTELWWTVRLIIESDQMRNLSEDVAQEGCKREWKEVAGNKIEIETKHEMRDRMGRSPDLFDWLACACEGARRRGLLISKFNTGEAANEQDDWLAKEAGEYSKFLKTHRLKEYA
jgi:hypothetical protein